MSMEIRRRSGYNKDTERNQGSRIKGRPQTLNKGAAGKVSPKEKAPQRQKGVSPVHSFERSDHGEPGHFLCRAAA